MNNRWRKQVKMLKPVIDRDLTRCQHGIWVEAVCGDQDSAIYLGVEGTIAAGNEALEELDSIWNQLQRVIPKDKLKEYGQQRLFQELAECLGELDLGDEENE